MKKDKLPLEYAPLMQTVRELNRIKLPCCGECCLFKFEMTDGDGSCIAQWPDLMAHCGETCKNGQFTSHEEMRHYMAVLLQFNRRVACRTMPPDRRMVDPTELRKAIDFAIRYMKLFSKL